jgi:RNA polymerase sigma-70 factor (ECF subfamily)
VKTRRAEPDNLDFPAVLREYAGAIYRMAYRSLGKREDAEDAAQEIWIRIYQALPRYSGESKISTWIFRITCNVCIAYSERKMVQRRLFVDDELSDDLDVADHVTDSETEYVKKESLEQWARLVSKLPPWQSTPINLFYLEERSCAEIAEMLNLTHGTVYVALHEGRTGLRKMVHRKKKGVSHDL